MVRIITQIITPPKKKNFKSLFLQIEKIFQIPATFYVTLRTLEKPSVHDPQPRPKFESSMLNNKPVGNGKLHQYLRPETKNVKIRNSFNSLFFIQEYTLELRDLRVSIDRSLLNKLQEEKVILILSP